MKTKNNKKTKYTLRIFLFYLLIPILIVSILYPILPIILNYPPDSIDNEFQLSIDKATYSQQYIILICLILSLSLIMLVIKLKQVNNYINLIYNADLKDSDKKVYLKKITKICLNTPFLLYYTEILVPLILLPISFILIQAFPLTILKICLIYIMFFTLGAVLSFVFSQKEFKHILEQLHNDFPELVEEISYTKKDKILGKKLSTKLVLQLLPLVIVSLCFTALVSYIKSCDETGDLLNNQYSYLLNTNFNKDTIYTENEVKEILFNIPITSSHNTSYFIIHTDGSYITSDNSELSEFFIRYTLDKSESNDYRTYDYYCVDKEGSVLKLKLDSGEFLFVGISYETSQPVLLILVFIGCFVLLLIIFSTLLYVTYSLVSDIKIVTKSLNKISSGNNMDLNSHLSITSADEFKDLSMAFNKIQDLTVQNIRKIHDSQETLMESERLASLGQLIGGIAHNLKTPIMSIAGAAEGLNDLINEYDSSIDDPTVNSQDHHDIAKDMSEWVIKIKNYTEYMSDIITAVKGQAVTLSETEDVSFDLDELVKRVNILMKHELKSSVIYLNIQMNTDSKTTINGDVNSLVQVINNMISNAIQAYNGKQEQNIDLILEKKNNNLVISVKDYGSGLPEKVKNKLFKEMITTKGKNGTGLGLYMSYSTIKAHFNGNITFESEIGKGTTFNIILPL